MADEAVDYHHSEEVATALHAQEQTKKMITRARATEKRGGRITDDKASFVQARRMFEVTLPLDRPPTPSGYPIHAIGENVEAFCDPGMYYELKRGVRKLKF